MTAKFKPHSEKLDPEYNPLELEAEMRRFWESHNIQQKLEQTREEHNCGTLGYVEGPPTLNGIPHIGHYRGRTMKDLRYRWKTMQGYYVPFWAGWDCQGLPVELEVEKLLGVNNKRELLEKVGQEHFIQECKKAIMKYHKEWFEADRKLGVFINQDKAYWTYKDEYIEREWQYLKRAWDQGLLEEGHYVVAYCPGCQTSLSSAEVGYEDSYQMVDDPSLHFKFKVAGSQDTYFLVWTTMPFTLATDTMLAVHPEAQYAKVRVGDEKWIMVESRVAPVMQELAMEKYEVLETMTGRSLEGATYEFPFKDLIPKQAELEGKHPLVHKVIAEDFVDVDTATGVVHQSPGNGEEDFHAAQKRGVPIFAPFDDEVKFTADAGFLKGIFARDADEIVVDELRRRGLLVSVKTVKHEYPTCWRSHHKLVWLARKEYFLRTDKINAQVVEAAEKVQYFYDSPRNRFLAFLREGKPWCISRERVWGTPLPVWRCQECGEKVMVASKRELVEKALTKVESDFELHKPWVDRVTLRCEKCGGTMHREDFVLDTWHNSGAAPFARFSSEDYERFVPADYLTEAMDQTRGWANTLLLEHVIFTGKAEPPYKAFLFQGLTQDAKGRKMSKSLGNVIEINKTLQKYSADVCRFYLLRKCSPIDTNDFDPQDLARRPYQVLSTLYHLSRFFLENSEYDGFDPRRSSEGKASLDLLRPVDRWVLSKLQTCVEEYTARLERCEFNSATALLEDFVIETLSRLYVPMIRRELWSDDEQTRDRRLTVYATLWTALRTVTLLFNPVAPYLCEELHQKVYRRLDGDMPESVNLENWPTPDTGLRSSAIEESFETLFRVTSLSYAARQSAKLKRRWPLSKAVIVAPANVCGVVKEVGDLFLELANVKTVEYTQEPPTQVSDKDWVSAAEGALQVYLDGRRDEKLLGEGLMRDLARRVQALRKELGYAPSDVLDAVHIAELDEENMRLLKPYLGDMQELVRAKAVHLHSTCEGADAGWREVRLDDKRIHVAVV